MTEHDRIVMEISKIQESIKNLANRMTDMQHRIDMLYSKLDQNLSQVSSISDSSVEERINQAMLLLKNTLGRTVDTFDMIQIYRILTGCGLEAGKEKVEKILN